MTYTRWNTKFDELFSQLDDHWTLAIVTDIVQEPEWRETQFKGIATFECSTATCNNTWSSVNAGAVFHYRFLSSPNHGIVKLFLGGQKCARCNDQFEAAQWNELKIEEALTKVLNKVKEKFYNSNDSGSSATGNAYIQGDRTGPHLTSHCQFCQLGLCQHAQQTE